MEEREHYIYKAKLAEQAERYDEMVEAMKNLAEKDVSLSIEERNLLSVAYKNVIGARRASWRIISSVEAKEEKKNGKDSLAAAYKNKIENELKEICAEILRVVSEHLIPHAESDESRVFYYKMNGDYYRYLAEFESGAERNKAADESNKNYLEATTIANKSLQSTHPIRLGLALNYSVFFYEIRNSPEEACRIAKESFDKAIADLDHLSEESYKDSTLIMQLLRDNLTLWTSDVCDEEQVQQQD